MAVVSLALAGCSQEEADTTGSSAGSTAVPRMTLNISPLTLGVTSQDVEEKIQSLRVIILSEQVSDNGETQSFVEYNKYFNFAGNGQQGDMFSGEGEPAASFRMIISRNSVPGIKKFYLIANEEKVKDIKFKTGSSLPLEVKEGMDLHDFLEYYTPDFIQNLEYTDETPEKGDPKGAEFENLVNCIYFTPEYNQEPKGTTEAPRYVIFLPYTSQYTYTLATQADIAEGKAPDAVNILNTTMYLVPGANKFRFCFQNYRPDPVKITSFKISGIAPQMYLFAQVSGNDLNKDFGSQKKLWWVDWLAAVSDASHSHQEVEDNTSFNSLYGWINTFDIPQDVYEGTQEDTMDNDTRSGVLELVEDGENYPWKVAQNQSDDPIKGPPGEFSTGYFYVPESKYLVDFPQFDDNGKEAGIRSMQAYYIKLYMISGENDDLNAVKDTQIANLGSLFRNTNTYITIKMRDALDVGAYAEISPWEESHSSGTVLEEEVPEDEI